MINKTMAVFRNGIANGNFESFAGQKVLITGANGFQARWLMRLLLMLNCYIIGIVRNVCPNILQRTFPDISDSLATRIIYEVADIRDEDAILRIFSKHKPSIVIHLAAQTEVGRANQLPMETLDVNVLGAARILEACRTINQPKAILFVSSDKFYGNSNIPYREEDIPLLNSGDMYGISKFLGDRLAQAYAANYQLLTRVVRPSNTYGPGQLNESTLITCVIKKILMDEQPYYLDGTDQIFREYTYIEDLISAYLLLIADTLENGLIGFDLSQPGEICFNIGSGQTYTAKAMIETIIELMEVDIEPMKISRQELNRGRELGSQVTSSLKFRQRFPNWHSTSVREGLLKTIEFYRRYYTSLRIAA